jgi:hypothetical protein
MDTDDFFNSIEKNTIDDFIKNNQEEHLNLEFKTVPNADFSNKSDQQNLSKCIAGFANSNGGVIIWGVMAKKNNQGIDCASEIKEIAPLSQFISKLNNLTGQLVKPIVSGVKHRKIDTGADKGFAVTLVPESEEGPHMAMKFKGRHYKRSGDSFYPMEHFDIEDMFGRRKKPNLSLIYDIVGGAIYGSKPNRKFVCHLFVCIENSGRGIAKHVAVDLQPQPYKLRDMHYHTSEDFGFKTLKRAGSDGKLLSLGTETVIHPSSSLRVALIPIEVHETHFPKDLIIDAEIMAEDMRIKKEKITISGKEIYERIINVNS